MYSYELVDNKLINPKLLLDLPVLPGPKDNGGVINIGPDNNIYLIIGDLQGSFRDKQYETMTQNYQNGTKADGRAGILRISQNGKSVGNWIIGSTFPLNLYYAYGIRNSFGIDWDPITDYLWDSENGPFFGDELNLVLPGFNSGWAAVQGFWKPLNQSIGPVNLHPNNLVDFDGRGKYNPPKFVWLNQVAPSAIKFINSTRYGPGYENDLLVGDENNGNIYDIKLDSKRQNLDLKDGLADKIANDTSELNSVIIARGFGKVTDMEIGPDGLLYILSGQKRTTSIYRIIPWWLFNWLSVTEQDKLIRVKIGNKNKNEIWPETIHGKVCESLKTRLGVLSKTTKRSVYSQKEWISKTERYMIGKFQ